MDLVLKYLMMVLVFVLAGCSLVSASNFLYDNPSLPKMNTNKIITTSSSSSSNESCTCDLSNVYPISYTYNKTEVDNNLSLKSDYQFGLNNFNGSGNFESLGLKLNYSRGISYFKNSEINNTLSVNIIQNFNRAIGTETGDLVIQGNSATSSTIGRIIFRTRNSSNSLVNKILIENYATSQKIHITNAEVDLNRNNIVNINFLNATNVSIENLLNVNGNIQQNNINVCLSNGTNCLPSTGSSDGTGGWTNTSTNTSTNLDVYINASIHADSYQRSNPINKSPLFETTFDDMNQNVGAYNRITTAPTLGTADNDVPSNINFPTANTYVSDGGLVLTGNVATNTATINVSHLKYYSIRARFTTGHKRTDMIGLFKTATSVNMVTAMTGVFFYANNSNYSALENNSIRNWTAMLCNAGTCSKLNSTVNNQTEWHIFTIVSNNREAYAPSNNFTFYIDGVNLGTLQTNMPTTRVATLGTWTESTDTTIDTLVVDWAYYEMYRI